MDRLAVIFTLAGLAIGAGLTGLAYGIVAGADKLAARWADRWVTPDREGRE
jgi:hypothetical protein